VKALNEDDPRRLLGGLLRQARAEAGLTQDAIGHAVSVERTGVTRMEGGERLLSHAALEVWLQRCGVTGLAENGIRAMWRAARRHGYDDEPYTFEVVRGVAANTRDTRRIISEANTAWESRQGTGASPVSAPTAARRA
jgi:transcriptional regulator with XRE-family HTH domain